MVMSTRRTLLGTSAGLLLGGHLVRSADAAAIDQSAADDESPLSGLDRAIEAHRGVHGEMTRQCKLNIESAVRVCAPDGLHLGGSRPSARRGFPNIPTARGASR
jgi:hypothetical protein